MNRALVFETAHQMAALPVLVWALRRRGDVLTGLLVGTFLVSWLADWPAHFTRAWALPVSIVYPLTQAGLVAVVFLSRGWAAMSVLLMTLLGIVAAVLWGGLHPDLPFRAACWGLIVLLAWPRRFPLRPALLVYFGLGLLAWAGYLAVTASYVPGTPLRLQDWAAYGGYQGMRLAGILLACGALWNRVPQKAVA